MLAVDEGWVLLDSLAGGHLLRQVLVGLFLLERRSRARVQDPRIILVLSLFKHRDVGGSERRAERSFGQVGARRSATLEALRALLHSVGAQYFLVHLVDVDFEVVVLLLHPLLELPAFGAEATVSCRCSLPVGIFAVLRSQGRLDIGLCSAIEGKGVHGGQTVQLMRGDALFEQVREATRLLQDHRLESVTARSVYHVLVHLIIHLIILKLLYKMPQPRAIIDAPNAKSPASSFIYF